MGNNNYEKPPVPHQYIEFQSASGRVFRMCTRCGMTDVLELVDEKNKDGEVTASFFAWFPCLEVNEDGKPRQGQRDCIREARGEGRDGGGNTGAQTAAQRYASRLP